MSSRIFKVLRSRDSSPAAQNDIAIQSRARGNDDTRGIQSRIAETVHYFSWRCLIQL
jgi:hypothetical protein